MHKQDRLVKYGFLIPAFTLLLLFMVIPFLMAFYLSLTNQRLIPGPTGTQFIGFQNYVRLYNDAQFWASIKNNFYFVVVVVPLQTCLALGLAMLVNAKLKFTRFFRTVYFMPTVTTMVVVSVIWTLLYNPSGMINSLLEFISFGRWEPIDFLRNSSWAFPVIMFMSIWQGAGFQMLIFLAGLQEIPNQIYEAAQVDGASALRTFWSITLPQLRNTSIFVVISTTILAFRVFDQVQIMTQGGPRNATYTMMIHIYNTAFRRLNIGYASSLTVVFFLIVLTVSIVQRVLLPNDAER